MKKNVLALSFCLVASFSVSNVAVAKNDYTQCEAMFNQMLMMSIKTRVDGKSIDTLRASIDSMATNPSDNASLHKMLDVSGNFIFDMSDAEFKRRMQNPKSVLDQMHKKVDELGLCD